MFKPFLLRHLSIEELVLAFVQYTCLNTIQQSIGVGDRSGSGGNGCGGMAVLRLGNTNNLLSSRIPSANELNNTFLWSYFYLDNADDDATSTLLLKSVGDSNSSNMK